MDSLDKKLEEIHDTIQYSVDPYNKPTFVHEIRKAFADDGWVRAAESKVFRDKYQVMTQSEWEAKAIKDGWKRELQIIEEIIEKRSKLKPIEMDEWLGRRYLKLKGVEGYE